MTPAANPPVTLSIRYMRLSDLEQVQAIDQVSFSLPWPSSAFQYELMENKRSLPMVAEINPAGNNPIVVATIVIWVILDEAHIATLAVHPDFRRRGIGQKLLATALLEAVKRGARSATLEVRARNLSAQALYKQFGFEVVGCRPRYYKDNYEDAVIMTRNTMKQDFQDWLKITASMGNTEVKIS